MGWIRQEGKLNQNTYLIDSFLNNERKAMASFMLKGTEKKALIDSSGPENAFNILERLKSMNLTPDILILTHSHWDHAGGTHIFQEKIKNLEVLAAKSGVKSLKNNKKYNDCFYPFFKDLKSIEGIKVVEDEEEINLGELTLKIYETPGHTNCSISIFDEKNKNLIIGDVLGYLWTKELIIPPIMPPDFSEEKLFSSFEKIKDIDYKSLSLAHFGLLTEEFALNFLQKAEDSYIEWRDFIISKWKEYDNLNETVKSFISQLNSIGIFDPGGKISHNMI
ncbi:MAG: MBL fold metallo-hydrolase, partial [Candidatus Lokiarchaeota archaeon]|nr:MBL fold metallo-hydrolase [Candidatus Lokiarchaeota archaeon]